MDAGNRRTLWQIIDESLWGKPAGAVAVLFVQVVLIALAVVPSAVWAGRMIEQIEYLTMGPWFAYMIGVFVAGLLALAMVTSMSAIGDPGRPLLSRTMAFPAPESEYRAAGAALRDVALAAGDSPLRLYVYSSAFPNAYSYCAWDGVVVVALSTALAESLEEAELRAVEAHLVARARAPVSRWLMLGVTTLDSMLESSRRINEPGSTALVWLLPVLFALYLVGLTSEGAGSALMLVVAMFLPLLVIIVGLAQVAPWVTRLVRPGLDEYGDVLGLHYLKEPQSALRAMQTVLQSDNMAAAGLYSFCFYAPPGLCASTDSTERARLTAMRTLLGAEAVGVEDASITGDSSLDALLMQDDVFK